MSIWEYANPRTFMRLSARVLPPLAILAAGLTATGLAWSVFLMPEDARQGASVKIMPLHVSAAMMAINGWLMMLVCSLIWLVRRHHVSVLAARAAAPVGAIMAMIALATGAIWGKPIWGTYWEWDPRMTSFLILFLFYCGYIALWSGLENPDVAADLTSVLCLVGSVFALLSRYAVVFWNQGLHQGSTFSLNVNRKETIADVFWYPAIVTMGGFMCLFVTLVLLRTRTEIRRRRLHALIAAQRRAMVA